jgi:glycosyltransferase involved in cell wall biosynthesis
MIWKKKRPLISVVMVVYNMPRVAPRTLESFTPDYQRVSAEDYEVIVVENSSDQPLTKQQISGYGLNFHYFIRHDGNLSPVEALNFGVRKSTGLLVGVMIDGAHLVTPGVLNYALLALRVYKNPVVCLLPFHLGPGLQRLSMRNGHSEQVEESLLKKINWPNQGYRLFTISGLIEGVSDSGWFLPLLESNCIFLLRSMYDTMGGFDERFNMKGGGYANLDFYFRLSEDPGAELIHLLGEGSFHQMHGGIATNDLDDQSFRLKVKNWVEQYKLIRGKEFKRTTRSPNIWGTAVPESIPFLEHSIRRLVERDGGNK